MKKVGKAILVTVVLAVVGGVGFGVRSAWRSGRAAANNGRPRAPAEAVPVALTPARTMAFEDAVRVSGNVEAKRFALVSARIPGTLDAVYVDEGDAVQAGKTRLFQTDSLKLTKAVAVAEQGLRVAEASLAERRARLEQAVADREQAERDVERYESLARDHAIPVQLLEKQRTGLKQAEAAVKDVKALIALGEAQLEQARLQLAIARKDLADSVVVAPITGVVAERLKEPGEMAAPGTPVVRIEDTSVLEISVFLPVEYYARIRPGKTEMRIRVGDVDLGTRPVRYKSPTVDAKLRTFEAKAIVKSPPEGVAPGCLADVTVVADRRQGVGVPAEAVVRRGAKTVVFVAEEGHARMVPVRTGRQTAGWTEITGGVLRPATPVVSMGQQLLDDGTPISVVREANS